MIKIKKTIQFILIIITLLFISKISKVYADAACDPYSCSGTGAYEKITACEFKSTSCGVKTTAPYTSYTCPTGGGSGTCKNTNISGNTGCIQTSSRIAYCRCTDPNYNGECTGTNVSSGQSCGPYSGYCTDCTYYADCAVNPQSDTLGCCNITTPPGTEECNYCNGNTCSVHNVPTGTCSTNCDACPGGGGTPTPTPSPGSTPSCSVSLSPSNTTVGITDSPFNITANVSNIQNGGVSSVEFLISGSSISNNPALDVSSPYQSTVTPTSVGTSTITAAVRMGGSTIRCSTATNVTVNTVEDTSPDCESFTVTPTSVETGENVRYTVEFSDVGTNLLSDGGFESGTTNQWTYVPGTGTLLSHAGTEADGAYFGSLRRTTSGDAYAVTDFLNAGETLGGKQYTLEFLAKSHLGTKTLSRVGLQTPYWSSVWVYPTIYDYKWTKYSYDINIPSADNTSSIRAVIRTASDAGQSVDTTPIYYDSVKVYKTSDAGISASTIKFYYATVADYAESPVSWIPATGTLTNTSGSTYTFDWDTTGVPQNDYYMRVEMFDLQGNKSTGNQHASSATYRPQCGSNISVTPCTPSCAPAGACGTLNNTPGAVSNVTVSGISGNTLNLSDNPLPRTISWTAASITSPSTITDHDVWLVPRNAGIPASEAACTASSTCRVLNGTAATSVSLPSVLPAQTNELDILVKAKNGCSDAGTWVRRAVNLTGNVSGTIYDSQVTESGGLNNCSGDGGGSPININTALGSPLISHNYGSTTTVPSSTYTLSDVPYNPDGTWYSNLEVALDLNNYTDPANRFFCNCPQAGNPFLCNQTDTTSPATGENFFVSAIDLSNGPWWQAAEGNVYGLSGYTNPVPDTCLSPVCNANTIIRNTDDDEFSAGAPMSGGTVSVSGYYTDYNDANDQPHANSTSHDNLVREDYEFFVKEVDLNNVQTISGTQTSIPSGGTVYGDGDDSAEVFYAASSTTFELNSETITGNDKKIIFVNGDITIENTGSVGDHVLTVDPGSYIAFIANGTITFENNIGNVMSYPTGGSTTTNIDGVFIADNIVIADDLDDSTVDNLFVGEGTFVGWDGIDLQRSYDNTNSALDRAINNEYPTAIYNFRPDFNLNTPEIMKRPNLVWQEVN